MRTNFCWQSLALAALIFAGSACSKRESETSSNTTVTPAPTASPPPAATASASPVMGTPTASPFADIDLRLHNLETKMDSIFSDSLSALNRELTQSALTSSIDVREQKDKYVVRVYVPGADTSKIDANIKNGSLHITTGSQQTKNAAGALQYEEIVSLPEPVQADRMKIDRKQNLVVVTVPKLTSGPVAAESPMASATPASSGYASLSNLDQHMVDEMRRMQNHMNQIFRDGFPNDLLNGTSVSRLDSAVNVDDEKGQYVVHFYLPDRGFKDVNVNFENGRLDLVARESKNASHQTDSTNTQTAETAQYEQMIMLPGPVKESEMKVDRRASTVVVTLPKA